MLVLERRDEAMTPIILHTGNTLNLLKRKKKIKKEVLFQYLQLHGQTEELVEYLELVNNSKSAQMLVGVIRQHKLTFNPNLYAREV